jgi:hypothetical protein
MGLLVKVKQVKFMVKLLMMEAYLDACFGVPKGF